MATTGPEGCAAGPARAERLIAELGPLDDSHSTPVAFARIVIGLFPDWFDFAPGRFAVLADGHRGLKLVVAGSERDFAVFPTSNPRVMRCYYYGSPGGTAESARTDMHYEPSPEHLARARAVVALALHRLFPERGPAPVAAGVVVPAGRVFPPAWGSG